MSYTDKYVLQEVAFQDSFYALTTDTVDRNSQDTFLFESSKDTATLRIFTTKVDAERCRAYLMGKLEGSEEGDTEIHITEVSLTKLMRRTNEIDQYTHEEYAQSFRLVVTSYDDNSKSREVLQLYPPKEEREQN